MNRIHNIPQRGAGSQAPTSASYASLSKKLRTNGDAASKMAEAAAGKSTEKTSSTPFGETDMMYASAVAKLRSGQELSSYEMELIKKRDPALYAKAQKVQQARLELRKRLESAKTSRDISAIRDSIPSIAGGASSAGSTTPTAGSAAVPGGDESAFALVARALHNELGRFSGKQQQLLRAEETASSSTNSTSEPDAKTPGRKTKEKPFFKDTRA